MSKVSLPRAVIILIVGAILGFLLFQQAATPIRQKVSDRFVIRGDSYVLSQDFAEAEAEYEKALAYNPENQIAKRQLDLTKKGETDIAVLRDFYVAHGAATIVDRIDASSKQYSDPKEAVAAGIAWYQKGESLYAQYPLQQAVELDPGYPEAWHYLGLVYQDLALHDEAYKEKAEEAWKTRDLLTPKYLP